MWLASLSRCSRCTFFCLRFCFLVLGAGPSQVHATGLKRSLSLGTDKICAGAFVKPAAAAEVHSVVNYATFFGSRLRCRRTHIRPALQVQEEAFGLTLLAALPTVRAALEPMPLCISTC